LGVNFKKVYLDSDGENMNSVMDKMIDDIMKLLEWINLTVGTDNFNHSTTEERF
jgi:hypothetical protein